MCILTIIEMGLQMFQIEIMRFSKIIINIYIKKNNVKSKSHKRDKK